MSWLKIIKNGVEIDHRRMGFKLLTFNKGAPTPSNNQKSISGRPGLISLGTEHGGRHPRASFFAKCRSVQSLKLLESEIHALFQTGSEMMVIDMDEPGKVWDVKTTSFDIEKIAGRNAIITVEFESSKAYARSFGTTQDPISFESGLWQFGQGLIFDDLKYTFTETEFSVFNPGVTIDPRYLPILIEFKGVSSNLRIRNMTTGEEMHYSGTTNANDILRLDRCRVTKNQTSVYRQTNKRAIKLLPGWNRFRLTGTSGAIQTRFIHYFYTI